jgi:phosphatidylglycerophosphate synthase
MPKEGEEMEFWDKIFRPITRPVTWFLIKHTTLSANQATWISLLMSFIAAYYIYLGDYRSLVIGGIFVILFKTYDNADGEIARARGQTSKLGHWFDGITGFITTELLILAMAVGIGSPLSLSIGLLTMVAFPMQYLLVYFYKGDVIQDDSPISVGSGSGLLSKVSKLYGSNFFELMVIAGCFLNKILYVLVFFAVIGNLFWMGTLFLQFLHLRKL